MQRGDVLPGLAAGAALLFSAVAGRAQAPLPVYTDHLVNGFQDWSWAPHNLASTSTVHTGTNAISVSAANWQALSFHQNDFNATVYASFSFWVNGGVGGGQRLQVGAQFGTNSGPAFPLPAALPANTWQRFAIPLSALGAADATNLNRLNLQLAAGGTTNTFYVDDVQLDAAPAPALVHVTVDAAQTLRPADARWLGVNTAIWDGFLDTASTADALRELGCRSLRFPGGSASDEYHWATGRSLTNNWAWSTSFSNFVHIATNLGAQAFITVNYGTGTSNEAAGWVRAANLTNHCGFRYWEIGNECYGTWETDSNSLPHDPYTYALRARDYIAQMKAADPTIKVGVVAVPGEDSYANYTTHPALNLRTGETHNGWTPVLLATLKSLGVTPDFLVHHVYPEYTPYPPPPPPPPANDSDALLLQSAVNWARDAADLRQQINDYFGDGGTNIELVCTENNSDAGAPGRQLTSIVNALYLADSVSQLMKTEFNAYTWWDLRNSQDTRGSFDPTLYGWRAYGDEGLIYGTGASLIKYPVFYGMKLMQYFVQPGDTVLNAGSDYLLLSAYATRQPNGALSVLIINKDVATNLNAQIELANFQPSPSATIRFYGIPQDEAARTGVGSEDIATNLLAAAATNFTCSFPPYSLTLFTFVPAAPALAVRPPAVQPAGPFVFQLQGQPGARYVLQNSTNLIQWSPVATNTLTSPTLDFTNAAPAETPLQFWRALWAP